MKATDKKGMSDYKSLIPFYSAIVQLYQPLIVKL